MCRGDAAECVHRWGGRRPARGRTPPRCAATSAHRRPAPGAPRLSRWRRIGEMKSSCRFLRSPHFTVYVSSSARSRAPACQFCKKPLYSLEIAAKSGSSNPNPLAFFSQSPSSFPHPTATPACSPPAPMPHNSGSTAPCPPAALPPPSPDSHPPSVAACLRQHLGRRCIPTGAHPGSCQGGATNADGA
jgi:hypothetical protein